MVAHVSVCCFLTFHFAQCQIWDPDNYDDDEEHGFRFDVSTEARFEGGIGSDFVKKRGTGEYAYVSFNIAFNGDLKSFSGTFSEDNEEKVFTWTGTSFDIPANVRKLIEDRLKSKSAALPSSVQPIASLAIQADAPTQPSFAVDSYLPAAVPNDPPAYSPGNFAMSLAVTQPGMSELKLWQVTSIMVQKDDKTGELVATDIVQAYVGKISNDVRTNTFFSY